MSKIRNIILMILGIGFIIAMASCDNGDGTTTTEDPVGTVRYNANGWNGGGIPSTVQGTVGNPIGMYLEYLDDTASQAFVGWSLTPGQNGEVVMGSYVLTGSVTLYVLWRQFIPEDAELSIQYHANGWTGGNVPAATKGTSGQAIGADKLPALASTETQVFQGWAQSPGQTGVMVAPTTVLNSNTNLYVRWRPINPLVTVSFNFGYADCPPPLLVAVEQDIPIGDKIPAVADTDNPIEGQGPTRPGYLFLGWYTERTGANARRVMETTTFSQNTTVYARWEVEPTWAWLELDLEKMITPVVNDPISGNPPFAVATFNEGIMSWSFPEMQTRGIILFTPGQRRALKGVSEFRLIIDGVSNNASMNYRYFIGDPTVSADWHGTDSTGEVSFEDIKDRIIKFNGNKSMPDGAFSRTRAFIIQSRTAGASTLTINSIKIRYDSKLGGPEPAGALHTVSFDRNYTEGGSNPASVLYQEGEPIIDFPSPTRAGHTFLGWFTEPEGGTQVKVDDEQHNFTDDFTLFAHWQSN